MAEGDKDTEKKYPYDELRYALSDPCSLTDDERGECGRAEKRRQTRNYAIGFAVVFAVGLAALAAVMGAATEGDADVATIVFAFVVAAAGLIGGIVTGVQTKRRDALDFVGDGVRRSNKKLEREKPALARRMHAEMDNPERPVYKEFYLEWQALRERGVCPGRFVNGWRFRGTRPVDILVDDTDGKVAVCSYYSASVLGVYDAGRICGCELRKGGAALYGAETRDAKSRETATGSAADGAGEDKGSGTPKKKKKEDSPDDYEVVVLFDGPDVPDMTFEFDACRALAEKAYRAFEALVKRNDGPAATDNGAPENP